ncbi:unnamed protein product, partial [marine sediment metagenome]
ESIRRIEQLGQEIARGGREIELKKGEIISCEEIISQKEAILTRFNDHQKFTAENSELTLKLQKLRKVEEEKILIERKIESERANLIIEARNKQDRYKDLQVKARQKEKNKAELLELEEKIKNVKTLEKESEEIRERGNKLNVKISGIENQIEGLEKDIKNDEEKIHLLKENPEGECPLCETKLNAEKKGKIEANLDGEIKTKLAEIEKWKREKLELVAEKTKLSAIWMVLWR